MSKVFFSGLKEWEEKLKWEVEELEDEREKTEKESTAYILLTGRIDMRYTAIERVEHQMELEQRKIDILQGEKK